jgi:hypothetical protein
MRAEVDFAEVTLQRQDTIDGLLKLYNRHDLSYVQLVQLRHLVYVINEKDIFSIGQEIKIPTVYSEKRQVSLSSIEASRIKNLGTKKISNYFNPIRSLPQEEDISTYITPEKAKDRIYQTTLNVFKPFITKNMEKTLSELGPEMVMDKIVALKSLAEARKEQRILADKSLVGIQKKREYDNLSDSEKSKIAIEKTLKNDREKEEEKRSKLIHDVKNLEGTTIPLELDFDVEQEKQKELMKKQNRKSNLSELLNAIEVLDSDTLTSITIKIMEVLKLPPSALEKFKRTPTYEELKIIFGK